MDDQSSYHLHSSKLSISRESNGEIVRFGTEKKDQGYGKAHSGGMEWNTTVNNNRNNLSVKVLLNKNTIKRYTAINTPYNNTTFDTIFLPATVRRFVVFPSV